MYSIGLYFKLVVVLGPGLLTGNIKIKYDSFRFLERVSWNRGIWIGPIAVRGFPLYFEPFSVIIGHPSILTVVHCFIDW
jgi:hypothetical protein